MKKLLLSTAFALFLLPAAAFSADAASKTPAPQFTDNATQKDINRQVCGKMKKADKDVDDLFNNLVKTYNYDPVFVKYLKETQKAWIEYRNARMQAIYPPEYHDSYGSVITSCQCNAQAKLDEERLADLDQWAGSKGNYAGSCAGTRR